MKTRTLNLLLVIMMVFAAAAPSSFAVGATEAGSSLLIPTTGQAMNGELRTTKSKVMTAIEVASVATIAILGTAVGGGVVWAGLGPLLANHAWSSVDAYQGAQKKIYTQQMQQQQLSSAQETLELSRQKRFEREQAGRSAIRERVNQAAQQAMY